MDFVSVCKLNWHLKQFAGVWLPDSMAGLNFKVFPEFYCFLLTEQQTHHWLSLPSSPQWKNGNDKAKQSHLFNLINSQYTVWAWGWQSGREQGDPSSLCSLRIMHVYNMHTGTQKYFLLKERH